MNDHDLIVHLGAAPSAATGGHPDNRNRHIRIPLWPRPGPLPGADLVVAHGLIALVVGVVRTRRHHVPLHYRANGVGLDVALARLLGVSPAEAPSELARTPTQDPSPLQLGGGLRILPAATRCSGTHLLVADPDPDQPPMEMTGCGPQVWEALRAGATLREVARDMVEASGGPPDQVEQSILRFAESLVDAGLAERL